MSLLSNLFLPKEKDEEEFSDGDLTPAERKALRRVLRDEARSDWLKGLARRTITWIAGIIIGLSAFSDKLMDLWSKIVKAKGG